MGSFRLPALVGAGLVSMFALSAPALAIEGGDWVVRAGITTVEPDSDNGTLALDLVDDELPPSEIEVDDGTSFTFNVSYFFTQNIAVELLAAYPFNHEFAIDAVELTGEVDHLPPTLSVQYHFPLGDVFKPYIGAGVNWTLFSDEELSAPIDVSLDDSVGYAGQVGVDIQMNESWLLNFDVRYINIESDVEVAGVDVGTVDINPWVFGVNIGYTF